MGRNIVFAEGEFYHVYHRGNDKREVSHDVSDYLRFLEGLQEFNTTEMIGSIYERSREKLKGIENPWTPLFEIVAYNLLPNHFHLVVRLIEVDGLSRFMKSQMGGYTNYYNEKYDHQGPIFAGPYKCKHIESQEYLDYVLRYVHCNHLVHKFGYRVPKFIWTSWDEKVGVVDRRLVSDWSHTCTNRDVSCYEKQSREIINELVIRRVQQKTQRNKDKVIRLLIE